jgi:hypothetical protein
MASVGAGASREAGLPTGTELTTAVAKKLSFQLDGVIKDPNLAPNHSFRHYLKSQLLDRDVPERISDAITGHKTPGIGRKYEHVEMKKKFKAVSTMPLPGVLPAVCLFTAHGEGEIPTFTRRYDSMPPRITSPSTTFSAMPRKSAMPCRKRLP